MRESRMETWVDIEMSIPSVLGLFSGADMLIRDMVTPLQSEMLIWFLALFLWLSPVNWRSLHWWNLRACENNWAHSKLQHSNFSATAYNSKDGSKNLHQWGHIFVSLTHTFIIPWNNTFRAGKILTYWWIYMYLHLIINRNECVCTKRWCQDLAPWEMIREISA